MQKSDLEWMREAVKEAQAAQRNGELPIAAIVVAGGHELTRSQTSPARMGTMVAHAELLALQLAGWRIFEAPRPIQIITTLEPCMMCLGAAAQCAVDRVVFGMRASVDGAGFLSSTPAIKNRLKLPEVVGGVLEDEIVTIMRDFAAQNKSHLGADYVAKLLELYK